jgi:ATP-binding cassette, subfamily B, bacterial
MTVAGAPSTAPGSVARRSVPWAPLGLLGRATAPWLAALVRPHRGRIALLVGLGLVAASAALVPPYLTKLVIDEGLMAGDARALVRWSLALLGFGFLSLGLGALASILHMRASVAMLATIRALLARTILGRSPDWRARHQTGELMARFDGDAGEVQQFAFNALLTGTSATLRLLGGVAMLLVLSPPLAFVALAVAPFELLFFAWARPRTEAHARRVRAERGALAARLAEMVQGLGQIQAARGEGPVALSIDADQHRLGRALVAAQAWGVVTRAGPAILTALARSAVFIAGGLMVIEGRLSLGALIAFIAYLAFLVGPLQSLFGLWHARARLTAALERLDEVMAPERDRLWPADPAPLPRGGGHLRFQNIAIERDGRRLLAGLDLDLPPGSRLRVAGRSGAGKTSLLALLQRHADPAAGRILLDGVDIAALDRDTLRAAITYLPQRPFLLRGSVAENLALSRPDAPPAGMEEVLDLVGLRQRFAPFGGVAATLGENGLTLSGGERQRLCLARGLLAPGRVLVLDEALSEVDPGSIARIVSALDARLPRLTRIVAAHGSVEVFGRFDRTLLLGEGTWSVSS